MQNIEAYQNSFISYLEDFAVDKEPSNLYKPINYILKLGGKRLRPVLTLMTTEVFGANSDHAMDAALSVEVFHNFSLVHDDIMDDAPLRRGKETVHEKWDINTGILSGDAMLIMAYQLFENYEPEIFQALARLFSKTALEVCEGQQYDVDFETRNDVTIAAYLKMIEYKTAVLVGAAILGVTWVLLFNCKTIIWMLLETLKPSENSLVEIYWRIKKHIYILKLLN
jgi:geranylgeranyl diphosphate synthase type II